MARTLVRSYEVYWGDGESTIVYDVDEIHQSADRRVISFLKEGRIVASFSQWVMYSEYEGEPK